MELYVVGQVTNFDTNDWELEGVYSSIELAEQNCFNEDCFVAIHEIDTPSSPEIRFFEKYWFPLYKG
jgi:hypothetical protein